jgi:hypothetical protein
MKGGENMGKKANKDKEASMIAEMNRLKKMEKR